MKKTAAVVLFVCHAAQAQLVKFGIKGGKLCQLRRF
jgi:hypothetical protein